MASQVDERREHLLDRIEASAKRCAGGSVSNPRYFAEMLAGCLAANPTNDVIALEVLSDAVDEIARLQRLHEARAVAAWANARAEELA
jgi:hypothetical protein